VASCEPIAALGEPQNKAEEMAMAVFAGRARIPGFSDFFPGSAGTNSRFGGNGNSITRD
jgi:hypothetical protein